MNDLRKIIKEKKYSIGTDICLKKAKIGEAKEIFIASNCKDSELFKKYCAINNITLIELKENNKELGSICKKTFSVSAICV